MGKVRDDNMADTAFCVVGSVFKTEDVLVKSKLAVVGDGLAKSNCSCRNDYNSIMLMHHLV